MVAIRCRERENRRVQRYRITRRSVEGRRARWYPPHRRQLPCTVDVDKEGLPLADWHLQCVGGVTAFGRRSQPIEAANRRTPPSPCWCAIFLSFLFTPFFHFRDFVLWPFSVARNNDHAPELIFIFPYHWLISIGHSLISRFNEFRKHTLTRSILIWFTWHGVASSSLPTPSFHLFPIQNAGFDIVQLTFLWCIMINTVPNKLVSVSSFFFLFLFLFYFSEWTIKSGNVNRWCIVIANINRDKSCRAEP